MGDLQGAAELTNKALAHLQEHAGKSNFTFLRRELQRVHDAARRRAE